MGDSKIFKCGFDITDYKHILPSVHEYAHTDEIINLDEQVAGNIENCVWKKYYPSYAETNSPQFRQREATRVLKTGVWVAIKEEVVWLPPNYYFALQYGKGGSSDLEFRLKRLKQVYFKIEARNNAGCKGTVTMKNRGDGETTMAITDAFWECLDGNMETGQIGIQSKTLGDGKNPCWSYVKTLWQSLPMWLKTDLCSDFSSGNNIEEKMQWQRVADERNNIKARNVLMTYYPSGTPMDGKHDMKKCILDEINKWEECSFYDTFTNYSKFIMPGFQRRGMFDMFSSPADKPCKSNEEVYQLWVDSNTDEIMPNGTTKSRIHRHYSNPLEGIAGSYDKFGDADPNVIYDFIMAERAKMPKDKLFAEVRGYPLNESEMFESADGESEWGNIEGIKKRKIYLLGTRFKNKETQEPTHVYGNLEWENGVKDSDVIFRMADKMEFDLFDARFCVSYLPQQKEELKRTFVEKVQDHRPLPPLLAQSCLGVDPIDKRYVTSKSNFSKAGMVNHKFLDIYKTGIVRCPTLIYSCRPKHAEIFFEDAIKAAVFNRAMVQTESINSKIIDYFEDRGYMDWLLSKRGDARNSVRKGDSPTGGKNTFLNEIISLIDAITNTPLEEGGDYPLERFWFYDLLDDISKFNRSDTQKNDLTMSYGQALMGSLKLLHKKLRTPSALNKGVLDYLLG